MPKRKTTETENSFKNYNDFHYITFDQTNESRGPRIL